MFYRHEITKPVGFVVIIYTNDLPNCSSKCNFTLYADDTNILYTGTDINYMVTDINADSPNIVKWFPCNKLHLNALLLSIMFHHRQKHSALTNMGIQIWVFKYGYSNMGIQIWVFKYGYSNMGIQIWVFKYGYSNMGIQIWVFKYGYSNMGIQIWVFKYGYSNMGIRVGIILSHLLTTQNSLA